jgi:flagellar motor component MotA
VKELRFWLEDGNYLIVKDLKGVAEKFEKIRKTTEFIKYLEEIANFYEALADLTERGLIEFEVSSNQAAKRFRTIAQDNREFVRALRSLQKTQHS